MNTSNISITEEITVSTSQELVWYAWTIQERVTQWFAPAANIEAWISGCYELYFIPGNTEQMNTKGCKIVELLDKESLTFTWKGPDQFKDLMNTEDHLTEVLVKLEELDKENTRIVIHHTGFQNNGDWKEAIDWHTNAWRGVLSSLKSALESGEGKLCCQPSEEKMA